MSLLPSSSDCCTPCTEPTSVAVPGPQGEPGTNGTNGTNGVNAFTLASSFIMPTELGNVTVTVANSSWMTVFEIVFAQGGGTIGFFQVQSIPTGTSVVLKNLEVDHTDPRSPYSVNANPGSVFPNGTMVVPAGIQGPAGVDGSSGAPDTASYITRQAEAGLSGEFSLGTLTTGLLKHSVAAAVSTPATAVDGTDYLSPSTGLKPADIGTTVQAFNANLAALAGLTGAADRLAYFTGVGALALTTLSAFIRTLLDDANAGQARATLGVLGSYGLLAQATAVDMNAVADTALAINSSKYVITEIVVNNASISLTTATAGLFTAAGGGGTTLAADQVVSALTSSAKFFALTNAAVLGTDVRTEGTLYFRVGTAQGAAATANVSIFGYSLP